MKKLFLTLLTAALSAVAVTAQTSLVATLNHDNIVMAFHGQTAFADAMAAAGHGDVITLSSGTFTGADITKAVTLRGAGIKGDVTQINGTLNLSIPEDATERLSVVGIVFSGDIARTEQRVDNVEFAKCQIASFSLKSKFRSYPTVGWKFMNCRITKNIDIAQGSSATFINCCVFNPRIFNADDNPTTADFVNCVVVSDETGGFAYYDSNHPGLYNCKFTNSFLFATKMGTYYGMPNSTNQAHNCVGYENNGRSLFANLKQSDNIDLTKEQYNALFKDGVFYGLTDEAKGLYIGNDGTEVGLYGGIMPYNPYLTSPQITKFKVSPKTTADGLLNVDIEVKAAE